MEGLCASLLWQIDRSVACSEITKLLFFLFFQDREIIKHIYGKDIVMWLINEARTLGIIKIYLESSECVKPLYRQLGFKDMKDYMKL